MITQEQKIKKSFFIAGPIPAQRVADSIEKHSTKTTIGAHELFLGQVRADVLAGKKVSAIEFSAYTEMAEEIIGNIREEAIIKHGLTCAHVLHSLGKVNAGGICLFVFTSSPHRKAAALACSEITERIKKEVPIFGKEIFENQTFQWKVNKD